MCPVAFSVVTSSALNFLNVSEERMARFFTGVPPKRWQPPTGLGAAQLGATSQKASRHKIRFTTQFLLCT
jgi:hypothetical protein